MACIAPKEKHARERTLRRFQGDIEFAGRPLAKIIHDLGIPILNTERTEAEMAQFKEDHCRERADRENPLPRLPSKRNQRITAEIFLLVMTSLLVVAGTPLVPLLGGVVVSAAICIAGFHWLGKCLAEKYVQDIRHAQMKRAARFAQLMTRTKWVTSSFQGFHESIPSDIWRYELAIKSATQDKARTQVVHFEKDPYARAVLDGETVFFGHRWE